MIYYLSPGGGEYEEDIQDAVDLAWYSFPFDDVLIVEEWEQLDGCVSERLAVWKVPVVDWSDGPPTASFTYRTEEVN